MIAIKPIILVCLLLALTGCGRDASELTVVTGIGVDGRVGDYQIGTEVIRLTGGEEQSQSLLLSADGNTVTDGIDQLTAMTGRSLYCNHAQVMVVGRETAESSILPLLEELLRGNQYPISLRLAVAKDSAAQVLRAKATVSDLHSVELEDMIRQGAAQSLTADMDVCRLYEEMAAPGIEGILPFIELRENEGNQVCALSGTALFRKEQLITVLNEQDSRCLMWMRGQSGGTFVTDHGPLEVISCSRKLTADETGAALSLRLGLRVANSEVNKEELMAQAEQVLKEQCESLLARLKTLQCDAVGFGQRYRQTHPHQWRAENRPWQQVFETYPITIQIQVEEVVWGRIWMEADQKGR